MAINLLFVRTPTDPGPSQHSDHPFQSHVNIGGDLLLAWIPGESLIHDGHLYSADSSSVLGNDQQKILRGNLYIGYGAYKNKN